MLPVTLNLIGTMSRHVLLLLSLGMTLSALGANPAKQPNILLIISDEHNASVLGCYGNKIARTPNLDGVAARGVVFESCYTPSPLCVPARLAITAGKYISHISAWNNSCKLPADAPSLPRILNTAGYESYLCGKMPYDANCRYGFTEIGGNMNNSVMTGFGNRRQADDLPGKVSNSNRYGDFRVGDDSGILSHDRKVTAGVLDFLSKRKAGEKPFFLLAGYLAPHFPLIVPESYWLHFKDKVPMPQIPDGFLQTLPRNYKHLRAGFQMENVPPEIVQKGRELYYGLTEWMDSEVGKVLKALQASAAANNTVIIYTTDHGEGMGEHGLWWKNAVYEQSARVPLIISWPDRWASQQRRVGACSLLDVVQTIAAIGGAAVPADWNGSSMVPWLDSPAYTWKDLAVTEYYAHFIASGYAMLRTGQYKYVYHTPAGAQHPAERELYDLKADPGEFRNLAGKPESGELIAKMHAALVKEIGENPDDTELRCRAENAKGYGDSANVKKGGKKKGKGNGKKKRAEAE
jgi:choline-sulfatase